MKSTPFESGTAMRSEKKPLKEKKSKAVHKATAPFGQREPCVLPRRASATAPRRREREVERKKKILDPPFFHLAM